MNERFSVLPFLLYLFSPADLGSSGLCSTKARFSLSALFSAGASCYAVVEEFGMHQFETAKQIGLTRPPNVLARADKVIK